jgi:hypothetical protein
MGGSKAATGDQLVCRFQQFESPGAINVERRCRKAMRESKLQNCDRNEFNAWRAVPDVQ